MVIVDHADLVVEGQRWFGRRVIPGPGRQARAVGVAGLREVGSVVGHPLVPGAVRQAADHFAAGTQPRVA